MTLTIKALSIDDGFDIYQMLQEIPADENGFLNSAFGKDYAAYQAWLQSAAANARQQDIVDGWKVPQSTYWLFADETPVGYGKIRHFLTDKLKESGGHLGYSIRPAFRQKGYGTQFLGLLVEESRKLGIEEIYLTIRSENIASIKTALANNARILKVTEQRHYLAIYP